MERVGVKADVGNGGIGKVRGWVAEVGADVYEGMRLAILERQNGSVLNLKSPKSGTLLDKLVPEGCEIKTGDLLCNVEYCPHSVIFGGLCTLCGTDLSLGHFSQDSPSEQRLNVAYESGLMVTHDEARRTEADRAQNLLKQQRLSLVLDLDHTLLHATDDQRATATLHDDRSPQTPGTPRISPKYHRGVHQLILDRKSLFVKLRPGLGNFLRRMSEKFELHIYTMGTRAYADAIAAVIDPEKKLFAERLTSRDDFYEGRLNQKNLRRVFPCDDTMVLIVDDREDVWLEEGLTQMPNLIKARPYHFFQGLHEAYDRNSTSGKVSPPTEAEKQKKTSEDTKVEGKAGAEDEHENVEAEANRTNGALKEAPTDGGKPFLLENTEENGTSNLKTNGETEEQRSENGEIMKPPALSFDLEARDEEKEKEEAEAARSEEIRNLVQGWWKADETEGFHLQKLAHVLEKIHYRYFQLVDSRPAMPSHGSEFNAPADVKAIVTDIRSQTLRGFHFAFTGVFPPDSKNEEAELWRLATRYGAVCHRDLNFKVTHLVVHPERGIRTRKAEIGREREGVFCVFPSFLEESAEGFERASELEHCAFPMKPEVEDLSLEDYRRKVSRRHHKQLERLEEEARRNRMEAPVVSGLGDNLGMPVPAGEPGNVSMLGKRPRPESFGAP